MIENKIIGTAQTLNDIAEHSDVARNLTRKAYENLLIVIKGQKVDLRMNTILSMLEAVETMAACITNEATTAGNSLDIYDQENTEPKKAADND